MIRAAEKPSTPSNVATLLVGTSIEVSWTAPYDGGSPIYAYKVVLMESDRINYSEAITDCDGTDATIVAETKCLVPIDTLITNPYNLDWGTSVFAKVQAINLVDESSFSFPGNGALLYTSPDPPQSLANNLGTSSSTEIGLTWYQGISDGGSPVLDYRVWYQIESGDYQVLADGLYMTAHTATGLTTGTTYSFKVQSRNLNGYSDFSNEITVIAAQKPSKPSSPTTSFANDIVTISWSEPATNGAPITAYTIKVRHSNLATYSVPTDYCDGSDSGIIAALQCDIPASVLNASPYSLEWGTSVYAKIRATNIKGTSTESNAGNGAIILTEPDPPVSLQENTAFRTATTLQIQWTAGAADGGTNVLDYAVYASADGAAHILLADGLAQTFYLAEGLTAGVTYTFKVLARNAYEYSNDSEELSLLCATLPLAPGQPSTQTVNH